MFEEYEIDRQKKRLQQKARSLGVTFKEGEFDKMTRKFGFQQTVNWTDDILDRLRTLRYGSRCNVERAEDGT